MIPTRRLRLPAVALVVALLASTTGCSSTKRLGPTIGDAVDQLDDDDTFVVLRFDGREERLVRPTVHGDTLVAFRRTSRFAGASPSDSLVAIPFTEIRSVEVRKANTAGTVLVVVAVTACVAAIAWSMAFQSAMSSMTFK